MTDWKDLLRDANRERTLQRARSGLHLNTIYDLGDGGFDPTQPLTRRCDCSGFIAWAIGIPREFPPRTDRWMDTDAYWNGGGSAAAAAGFPLLTRIDFADAREGDLIVYPDSGGSQGHMGILSVGGSVDAMRVIHCSRGNWLRHGDAVRETDVSIFTSNSRMRVMRIDYPAFRRYCDIAEPDGHVTLTHDENGGLPDSSGGVAAATLQHSLLANQPTLQLVLKGELKLSRTGRAVSGIASVQQAMNILARTRPRYAIDLGPNEANSGIFGPRTERALAALQSDTGLPQTGVLDAATLLALDRLLMAYSAHDTDGEHVEGEAGGGVHPVESETGAATTATVAPLVFEISHEGSRWYATTEGVRFYVGSRVRYEGRWGLMNTSGEAGIVYRPEEYEGEYPYWAHFIVPTAVAESRSRFKLINSYDSAGFTFGFLQFAAHVAEGDFVKFFRALLGLGEKARYFPDLELRGGRITRTTSSGPMTLETATSSDALRRYLNPSGAEVEDREVLSAAKFIHWSLHSKAHRDIQVRVGIQTARDKLRAAQRRMNLDGRSDKVCLVVMDILHQGRGTYSVMKEIVENNNDARAYEKLLEVGAGRYPERIATIRAQVGASDYIGTKRYVAATGDFA